MAPKSAAAPPTTQPSNAKPTNPYSCNGDQIEVNEVTLVNLDDMESSIYSIQSDTCTVRDYSLDYERPDDCVFVQVDKKRILVTGGGEEYDAISTVTMLDMDANTVTEKAPMKQARIDHGIALSDFTVYVIGGWIGRDYLNNCEAYLIADNSWSTIASLNIARRLCTAQAMPNGQVYVFGGIGDSGLLDTIECYDPVMNQWTLMSVKLSTKMAYPITHMVSDTQIIIIGGYDSSNRLSSVELFDTKTETLSSHGKINEATHKANSCSFVNNGSVYLLSSDDGCQVYDLRQKACKTLNVSLLHFVHGEICLTMK